jgi:hypothetical protein
MTTDQKEKLEEAINLIIDTVIEEGISTPVLLDELNHLRASLWD